ncbi:beta-glucuronidase [Collinsella ureilytica]|uniref:beta-glucuronidase n=1 Tax=Collinsella ureilytica TaxID=2869515 RepID=UPI00352E2139
MIRPVKLYTTPKKYIEDITLVSKIDGTDAKITYDIQTVGDGPVFIEVYDKEGGKVAEATGKQGELTITDAHLWEPLAAYLYDVVVRFEDDTYTERYGIRTIEVKNGAFLINSKPFYFKGYGKHEDTFPNGRGINLAMNQKDISLMKWQHANSFRTSHYPYSEEMMNLCDEEGIVVIDEVPAVGIHLNFGGGAHFKSGEKVGTFDPVEKGGIRTFEHHKEVLRNVIARDKNHACVVMWSIANEADSSAEGAYEYFKPLYDLVRALDPQKRPRTIVSVQMQNYKDDITSKLSDVICLNRYYGWYFSGGDLEAAKEAMAEECAYWDSLGKPFMLTEYGADTVMGLHDTVPTMWTEEYQVLYYKMNHEVVDACKNFCGEQVWNFADFATSQGLMRVQGNKKGLFTRDRKPKLAAHYFKDRWEHLGK